MPLVPTGSSARTHVSQGAPSHQVRHRLRTRILPLPKRLNSGFRSALLLGIVLLVACLWPSAASARVSPSLLAYISTSTPFEVRPPVIGAWTGDGTGFVGGADGRPNSDGGFGHITWKRWTAHVAAGKGVAWVNRLAGDCRRNCWSSEPTRIRAYRVRHGHFTRLKFSYDAGNGRQQHVFRLQGYSWL
jgi:hypothetical protein